MKIALPLTASDEFSAHYGAAAKFVVFDVDLKHRTVRRRVVVEPQASEPCGWPPLLRGAGTDLVLAGGMGRHALARMAEHGLKVVAGVPTASPDDLVAQWLAGALVTGKNACEGGQSVGHGCREHEHRHHEHDHDHHRHTSD
ncbi:MAG TPA: NifB/NifX family molybdenum-iron cluster-binding protein [Opitutaceae bacterium]|nr:NifB/NifX family molybdenum-iron cluster-binding protein [Opitutaceae bacterium]